MTGETGKTPAIALHNVRKVLGGRVILDDVDLDIMPGRISVLLGPSGAGKSTLFRLAVGLMHPDAGTVHTLGQQVATLGRKDLLALRRRFGMLFQDGALFGSLNVAENVAFPLKHHTRLSRPERMDKADHLLAAVGLAGFGDRMPDALSGGQRKRVAFARAIALEPELVFFDEPTSGLDPMTSAAIDELLLDMQERQGTTFVVITHDTQSAARIADDAFVLVDGKLPARGTKADVWSSQHPVVRAFLDRAPLNMPAASSTLFPASAQPATPHPLPHGPEA